MASPFVLHLRAVGADEPRIAPAFAGRFHELPDDPTEAELFAFAHLVDGYAVAQRLLDADADQVAHGVDEAFDTTGEWTGSVLHLLVTFFFHARAARYSYQPFDDQRTYRLYQAIVERLRAEPDAWAFAPPEPEQPEQPEQPEAREPLEGLEVLQVPERRGLDELELAWNVEAPAPRSFWVVESRVAGGGYPGDPNPDFHAARAEALWEAGFRTFVSLVDDGERDVAGRELAPYAPVIAACAERSGETSRCVRVAVRDRAAPSVEAMTTLLDVIDLSLEAGRPVYVHCVNGVGRTATVLACWLRRHRLASRDDVFAVVADLRRADEVRGRLPAPETEAQRETVLGWA